MTEAALLKATKRFLKLGGEGSGWRVPLAQETHARACPSAHVGDMKDFLTPCQWVSCSCCSLECPELPQLLLIALLNE